jgi:hypothetical protein
VQGPDRKTPSDGMAPAPPSPGPDPGDPQQPSAGTGSSPLGAQGAASEAPRADTPETAAIAAPEIVRANTPDAPRAGTPETPIVTAPLSPTPATPSGHEVARREAETPRASSISSARIDGISSTSRGPGRRSRPLLSRMAARAASFVDEVRDASPMRKALALAGGAVMLVGALLAPRFFAQDEPATSSRASAASLAGSVSALGAVVDGGSAFFLDPRTTIDAAIEPPDAGPDAAPRPTVWRLALLADNPDVAIVDVPIAHKSLSAALAGTKVPHGEGLRVITSLGDVHSVDHFAPKDALTVAMDKSSGHVMAFEFASSPADVWQARDDADDAGADLARLWAKKLKLEIERVRVRKAVLVGADLHASFVDAGLGPIDDLLPMLDDALDGHAELSDVRPGARLRIVGTQDQVDGAFVRWVSLEAVEYFPSNPTAPSVRVYRYGEDDGGDDDRHAADATGKRRRGWYDGKGRQPFHGGWRTPVPLARITSRFNPHRMHPVLHVIMPHNGVDFAAPVGTPVYATAAGTVLSAGNGGPCGNKIEIAHPGNIVSVYCHLSRFAAGLHPGEHVEQRQLIAYVGQTGRVTGPHLHFGIRRNGIVIDPMTLRLDGMRVVPRAQRDEFDKQRSALDAELDSVPLPASAGGSVPAEVPEGNDSFYEEP